MRLFLTTVLLLLCTEVSSIAAEPIKIGLSLGLTGKHAEISDMQMKAFRLWERDTNKKGGILGRNVSLIIYDDKSDPQSARNLYEQLITKERVDMVFSPYSSELTEAVLPVTERYGYPVITSGASADRLWQKGHKYVFGILSPASRYTTGFLEMAANHGLKNIAIFYSDDVFSKSSGEASKKWAQSFGLNVLSFFEFKQGSRDFTELAKKARGLNAELVMICGYFDEAVAMRQAMKKIGWYPKAFYASIGPALPAYYDKLGQDANLAFSSSQWEPHGKLPGSKFFHDKFVNLYGKSPSYQAADAYAGGEIMTAAITKAGRMDRHKIRDVLSTMKTTSIIGRYGVDKNGKQIKHMPLIIQLQKGNREIVWPSDLITAKPIIK